MHDDGLALQHSRQGICKLTADRGKFVKAHLIPAALTERGGPKGPLTQHGQKAPQATRRWTSWYDEQLVTAAGERILATHDNWGISELYRQKLVWGSWGPMLALSTSDHRQFSRFMDDPAIGFRRIRISNPGRLRVFFLSLLWRAAETFRWEFDEVAIDEPYLSMLRKSVLDSDPNPLDLFPVELIQISTRGVPHNHSPVAMEKTLPSFDDGAPTIVPHYRFYFDGLIVHFDRRTDRPADFAEKSSFYVGCREELTVTTVPYETSFQRSNIEQIIVDELLALERMTIVRMPHDVG